MLAIQFNSIPLSFQLSVHSEFYTVCSLYGNVLNKIFLVRCLANNKVIARYKSRT